jgi:diguanylate cyclase (GGDEF)-like protein
MKLFIALSILLLFTNFVLLVKMLFFRKVSLQDELTKLPNFRQLNRYIKIKNKLHEQIIVIVDIDNFKEFNKISIHKGDEVLREFSDELSKLLFSKAFISRYRLGDEFAFVFLNKSKDEIENEIINIKSYFNNYSFKCLTENINYRIAFCYGISLLKPKSLNFEMAFDEAELELAEAKSMKK